jgi:radical SAM superfamily enzyme YgiQ (UPF0313 family)
MSMKIVLGFPPFYLESMYNLPPLGLIRLATALGRAQNAVVLLDFVLAIRKKDLAMGRGIYDECVERILAERPDIVGISVQSTTFPAAIQLAQKIRDKGSDVKIVLGGHSVSFADRLTLERFPFIDAIVRGEGEETFKALVQAYDAGVTERGIPGVTFRERGEVLRNPDRMFIERLDDLPLPDYRLAEPFDVYRDACDIPRSIAILEVGRGCPHHCIYCSESLMWRRQTRQFSPSRLVAEMEVLYRNHGAECFLLAYDQFTAKRPFVESFCHKVIEAGLSHLPWYCISRLDTVDGPVLELMKRAGCESMCYGIDSGSKRTLHFIRKQIDHDILYQRVAETADQGIIPTLSFVIGFPEEERQDIDETLLLALRTGIIGNNHPLIQLPTVLQGTDLYSRYQDRLVRCVDTYFALGLEFDQGQRLESDEALIDAHPDLFCNFYNVPCRGISLEDLDRVANDFPWIVRFFPKTFLLMGMELNKSPSRLFLLWVAWLGNRVEQPERPFSPKDCYRHFRGFVSEVLSQRGPLDRDHLPDILKYEDLSVEAGKFSVEKQSFHMDVHQIDPFTPSTNPLKNRKLIVGGFDFPVSEIIFDLRSGRFNEKYAPTPTIIIFRQHGDVLDTTEINPFGKDLLDLCDGSRSVEAMAENLYAQYGQEMTRDHFVSACLEAVESLGTMGLLETRGSE